MTLPPGTRVEKINSEPDDTHQDGAPATVLRRFPEDPVNDMGREFGYFVHWDDLPDLQVFIAAHRIRPLRI